MNPYEPPGTFNQPKQILSVSLQYHKDRIISDCALCVMMLIVFAESIKGDLSWYHVLSALVTGFLMVSTYWAVCRRKAVVNALKRRKK